MTSGWKRARLRAELPQVRVHDLKHTFGRRLRAAGVSIIIKALAVCSNRSHVPLREFCATPPGANREAPTAPRAWRSAR